MTTYYVDPAASGSNDGTSWTDAWTNVQSAFDTATAGDKVYCRGTQTLTVSIDMDTNSGSTTAPIEFVGCNASGNVDGTLFVLDGNSAATNCLNAGTNIDYINISHFQLKNATGNGFDADANRRCLWYNCHFNNNGAAGWGAAAQTSHYTTFIRCRFYSNTTYGVRYTGYTNLLFCTVNNNTSTGVANGGSADHCLYYGSIIHDNGGSYGIYYSGDNSKVVNCVIDGESTGISNPSGVGGPWFVIGCRITNNTTGVDHASSPKVGYIGWNYFHGNTTDKTANMDDFQLIKDLTETDTNKYDVDADDGYNDRSNDDFNLKESRTLRRTSIDLGLGS